MQCSLRGLKKREKGTLESWVHQAWLFIMPISFNRSTAWSVPSIWILKKKAIFQLLCICVTSEVILYLSSMYTFHFVQGFKIFFFFSFSGRFSKCRFCVLSLIFLHLCIQVLRPGSVPPNTRDNLYQGLPLSVKAALKFRLQDTTNGGYEVSEQIFCVLRSKFLSYVWDSSVLRGKPNFSFWSSYIGRVIAATHFALHCTCSWASMRLKKIYPKFWTGLF